MNKTNIICKIVSILMAVLAFVWFWSYDLGLELQLFSKNFTTSFSIYSAIIFVIGFVSAVIFFTGELKPIKMKSLEYEKRLSVTSVDKSKDKAKIESLERKIATLEKALESKLDR